MRIATAHDAAKVLAPFFASAREERVVALHLDAQRRLLALTLEQMGDAEEVTLPVPAILASTLRLGAKALIVAHNHPSGDARPSEADKEATRRLADAARPLGLRLLDHLIFGNGAVQSLAALELL
jgi:DNA repair protein RadC